MKAKKIQRFTHEFLDSAAKLAVENYKKQFKITPFLPESLKKEEKMKSFLQDVIEHYPGMVILQNDKLIGYFTGFQILGYVNKVNAIYIPDWGHYAEDLEDYYNMYKELAAIWIDRGYRFHMISVYSTLDLVQETISWLGFGKMILDGILNAATFVINDKDPNANYEIRKGGMNDLHFVIPLSLEFASYMSRSPIFLQKESPDMQYYKKWAETESHHYWLAFSGRTPIGYIQIESGAEDVSTIVRDPESVSITGMYVSPSYRNKDVGRLLLEQAVNWTKENALRLCVDFEATNNLAREFWLKYFKPFSFTYYRYTL
jgi:GNAT superfamily N-acetyltransferase